MGRPLHDPGDSAQRGGLWVRLRCGHLWIRTASTVPPRDQNYPGSKVLRARRPGGHTGDSSDQNVNLLLPSSAYREDASILLLVYLVSHGVSPNLLIPHGSCIRYIEWSADSPPSPRSSLAFCGVSSVSYLALVKAMISLTITARPLPGLWDPRVDATRVSAKVFVQFSYVFYGELIRHCLSYCHLLILRKAFTAVTDLFYALSPIYFLRRVQIEKRRKAGILTLIGLGIL